jgi:hypothetical protein
MPKRSRKDINVLASEVAKQVTQQSEDKLSGKNPSAVALGRLGGLKGGKARAKKLTAQQRKQIATKAARTRWGTKT